MHWRRAGRQKDRCSNHPQGVNSMKDEYVFSKATRGKFFRKDELLKRDIALVETRKSRACFHDFVVTK